MELESRVCQLICDGNTIREILKVLKLGRPPVRLNRQQPYQILRSAALRQRLRYEPPIYFEVSHRLKRMFDWLHSLDVVHTATLDDIAKRAAENLLDMISGSRGSKREGEYHLGFAGGGLLQLTALRLAEKISRTTKPLPKRIVFHAMVARFGENPLTDPNSFVGYFTSAPLPVEIRFVGLMAPGLVSSGTARHLGTVEGIREAFERISELDVIVTSAGGHWKKGCSQLFEEYRCEAIAPPLLPWILPSASVI